MLSTRKWGILGLKTSKFTNEYLHIHLHRQFRIQKLKVKMGVSAGSCATTLPYGCEHQHGRHSYR